MWDKKKENNIESNWHVSLPFLAIILSKTDLANAKRTLIPPELTRYGKMQRIHQKWPVLQNGRW